MQACHAIYIPMMKRGNEPIGSKVNFPLEKYKRLHSVHVAKRQHFLCDSNS